MPDPGQLNSEVARLLQILTSGTGTGTPHPPSSATNIPTPPLSIQPQVQPAIPQWPAHQARTADPRLAAFTQFPGIQPLHHPDPQPYPPSQPQGQHLPPQHQLQPQPQPQPQPQIRPDPSSITEWPAALRYVTTVIVRDELVMAKLLKMKKNQKDNELSWQNSRHDLLKKHSARIEGNKQVDEILKQFTLPTILPSTSTTSISNNHTTTTTTTTTTTSEEEELHTFDLKVHKAATAMVNAMSAELGILGIPFFCGGRGGTPRLKMEGEGEGGEGYGIEERELRELRRRMMDLMGDLVGE